MAIVSTWGLNNNYLDSLPAFNDLAEAGTGNSFSTSIVKRGSHSLQLDGAGYASKTSAITEITGGNADRSMGGFFYSTTAINVEAVMFVGQNTASQGFLIIKLSGTTIRVDLQSDALSFTVPALSNATWYWVWVEYTAATKTSDLYLDNVQSSSGAQAHAANSNLVTNNIYFGADAGASNLFIGNLDQFNYYNGVTTAGERAAIFTEATMARRTLLGIGG